MLDSCNILRHHDADWLCRESLVWVDVLDDLAGDLAEENPAVEKLIAEARACLNRCATSATSPNEPIITEARNSLMRVLEAVPDFANTIDAAFVLKFSLRSVEDVVDQARDDGSDHLGPAEKARLKSNLAALLNSFDAKLDELSRDLDSEDSNDDEDGHARS